jgi:polyphosphate kinase 2 (PPK2 family)
MNQRIAKIVLRRIRGFEWEADVTYLQRHVNSIPKTCTIQLPQFPWYEPRGVTAIMYEICLILDVEGDGRTAVFEMLTNGDWVWNGEYR